MSVAGIAGIPLMKMLPFESYAVETTSLVSELVDRLQSHTERPRFIRWNRPNSEFVGWVSDDGFQIKPVGCSGTSFVPELFGRFARDPERTHVFVEMIPSSGALAVIAALTGTIAMMVFYSGPRVFTVILGGILLAWLFSIMGFWLEAGRSRPILVEIMRGRSDESFVSKENSGQIIQGKSA